MSKRNSHAIKCDECDSLDGAVACMWCVDCEKSLCEECYNKPHTTLRVWHWTMLLVTDTNNHRVQVFTADGKFVSTSSLAYQTSLQCMLYSWWSLVHSSQLFPSIAVTKVPSFPNTSTLYMSSRSSDCNEEQWTVIVIAGWWDYNKLVVF